MALTAAIRERTPYHLLYLVTQDGQGGTTLTIPNDNGATPDLGTDSLNDTPIGDVADYAREHALVLTQAQARALLLGDDALGAGGVAGGGTGPGADFSAPRCHSFITPRTGAAGWLVDANQTAGDPDLRIVGPAGASTAYLLVQAVHSIDT